MESKLMKMNYFDPKAETRLEAYADTVVIEKEVNIAYLAAARFGGYPESVKGMNEAIYGGGSVSMEIDGQHITVYSRLKQYRKELSHDGIYAESTLLIQDEEQRADDSPRRCYLFCEQGNNDRLFEELDKKTSVPLIPEFQNYVLGELKARGILKQLQVISAKEKFDVWALELSKDEENVIAVVNDGLKSGAISIPGATANKFPDIRSVTQYLNTFGVMIAERIKSQFNPLFDPATETLSPEILAVNEHIKQNAGYSLYDAQLAIAEAHKRCLEHKKATLCISECGSGKTKIGITALHAYQQKKNKSKHFNVVLCPSHMTKKWVREIEESLPSTLATVVTSISEIDKAYEIYQRDDKTCYIIISKEKARDGYMRRPSVKWNQRRKAFICPACDNPVEMELSDDGSKYRVPADQFYFKRENKANHKCEHCGSLLWTALVPEQQSEWVKVTELGFVHRRFAHEYLEGLQKKPALLDAVQAIADNPDGTFPNTGAYRRFPLSTYIKRHMKGKIDDLIIDELHNYNNNSGQGDAMGELFGAAKRVVGMTATLINGYSSGIFHLLFRISPDLMLKDGKRYDKSTDFNAEYGVTESVYEIAAPDYNSNRRTAKRKIREKQLPGVSPLVYSRFLMDSAAFLSLNDMGKDLPEYEEMPIQLQMNEDVAREYFNLEARFKDILRSQKDISKKVLSAYLGLLTVYPDQPYGQKPVVHPVTGDELVVPQDVSSFDELHEKDRSVLDVVARKTAEGGRVLIYTSWTRIDSQRKLSKLLEDNGYRVATLTSGIPPNRREEWVEKQVQDGVQVLITNPSLVETGLDLNDFTTLYYYNIAYNLFTLRQSSRRSWRINQKAPKVEVYFSYYEGTMQHRAIRLMASKLAVAGIIEGNFTDEGLAAMSDCADMTTALARELTQGIKNEVEDLSAVFKKMAILKPDVPSTTIFYDLPGKQSIQILTGFPDDFDPFADSTDNTDSEQPVEETPPVQQEESAKTDIPAEAAGYADKPPVFEYAGASENIDDISKTFDELRIEKSQDFPELEDGKRVSWTVEYGKITKTVAAPKGTSISKMKSDIETSKEFEDSLKKRGADKNPTCKVKPRVTAQSKGQRAAASNDACGREMGVFSSYKAVFISIEDADAAGKVISIVPARDGKVYEIRNAEMGRFITPVADCEMLSDVRAGFIPALPLIPMNLMMRIVAYFRYYMRNGNDQEVLVNVYWDKKNREFIVDAPEQIVSKVSVESRENLDFADGRYIHYMDIHSHNSMKSVFSQVEEAIDNLDRVGFGSYFRSRVSHEAFHLMLLNPPYLSVMTEGGNNTRSEKRFLVDSLYHLIYGGLLIYIIPHYCMTADICRILCDNFDDLTVWKFAGEEFKRFKQVAIMGIRHKRQDGSALVGELASRVLEPDMNEGSSYLYDTVYRRMSRGQDVRLSELDFDAFEAEDVDSFNDLYSDVFERNHYAADGIASALRSAVPASKAAAYV